MIEGREAWNHVIFSVFSFVISFLLVHVVINLFQVFYMHASGINFTSSFIHIHFLSGDQSIWDDSLILIVFGLPYLISLATGVLLLGWLAKGKKFGWRLRLFLIWVAVNAILKFVGGLVYAAFFYDGLGFAFHWMFSALPVRIGIMLLSVIVLISTSGRWTRQFFKASPTRLFFQDIILRYRLIWFSVLIPWATGCVIIMITFYPPLHRGVLVTLCSYMLAFVPMLKSLPLIEPVRLIKSEKKVFPSRFAWIFLIVLLFFLRFALRIEL